MFTRPEGNFISNSYFKKIQYQNQHVYFTSINTNHCWVLSKQYINNQLSIQINHKHNPSIKYYHKHGRACSVKEAVEQIKQHDKYVVEDYLF